MSAVAAPSGQRNCWGNYYFGEPNQQARCMPSRSESIDARSLKREQAADVTAPAPAKCGICLSPCGLSHGRVGGIQTAVRLSL
jgi:hypothetical protein